MTQLAWSAAIRIAWRELRASRAKFLFVVLAVAVGVGSLTGVRGFSRTFRRMLLREARTLMAGDMTLRVFALPSPEQQAALDGLAARGVRRTWITETVTMAASGNAPDPLLISVKAVDPALYPFYGTVKLEPARALRDALDAGSVVVSDDLLMRLNVRTGDMLRIGGQDFRIAAVVTAEPDRMTGSLNVGPRVMITRAGLERTGLIQTGSRAAERYLFSLPAAGGPSVDAVRAVLKQAFPEATIADYRETHPIITRGLDRATTFLSLIALIALVIGAMGVASAMHGHLQQKLDSIAVMKCMGARSGQVMRIYVAQTLLLGLGGGLLGVLFGAGVTAAFPGFIAKYFQVDVAAYWDAWPAVQGIAVACLITLLFTVPPLLGIREIRPALILRRSVDAGAKPRPAWAARIAILLGTGAVAATLTEGGWRDTLRTAEYFTGGLAIGIGLLWLAGWGALRGFRGLLRRCGKHLAGTLRHGIANLYRPGNQAQAAVVSLGVGVMFTLTVYLVQSGLVEQIRGSAPPGMPNVFLLDIPANQKQALSALIQAQPGVKEAPDVAFAVAAKIAAIGGEAIEKRPLERFDRRFLRTRSVTAMAAMPPDTVLLAGEWWREGAGPQVCVHEEAARILKLKPGDAIDWTIWGKTLRTRVACIERTESIRMSGRFEFLFSPGALDGFPAVYYGSARVRPADVAGLQRAVYRQFPAVTVVNVADVMQIVEDVVERIAAVIRFISAFTVLAGAVMVASSVAGTRFRRMREVVTLKTLGATRRRIAWIFTVEFLALGAVAGVMGTALAAAFAGALLKGLMEVPYHPGAWTLGAAVLSAAGVAAAAGWAASFRILGRKPLEILREE
ncbi:MAG: FtsX-like permease family protein [Acidobacteriota bacterium]|nr:FtsX-like permease family protein [Acidobacteriota bacterium]